MKIEIDKKHIEEAEKFLINGKKFDEENYAENDCKKERIKFINNLETCDLLAVPGSGKTTALMAKLYCLSKQMPFSDGSGILVLAHTNAAVDEIEKKLKRNCPNLFEYPNFVGTIQSFVNKFLAIPNYVSHYKYKPYSLDGELYEKRVESFYKYTQNDTLKKWLDKKTYTTPIAFLKKIRFDINYNLKSELNKSFEEFELKNQNLPIYKSLKKFKKKLIEDGILHYDDGYFLAEKYILKYPQINSILKNRFKFVFIDEMQDLEEHQIEIIDKIFDEGKSNSVIQRIGDINQSIYNLGKIIKIECDWKPRKEMYLTDSNRLTKSNAELVDFFTLDKKEGKFNVIGKRVIENGDIKPHLILYKKDTKSRLRDKFEEIIKFNNLHTLPEIKEKKNEKEKFKIIGWAGERTNEEDDNLCLNTIFGYTKLHKSKKEYHTTLSKYIQLFDKDKKTLEATRKSILNALTTVLFYEQNQKTITQLINIIKENGEEVYEDFKLKLYNWSFELATLKNYEVVFNSIKKFIENDFKNWFNFGELTTETKEFMASFQLEIIIEEKIEVDATKLNIDIATVHSVKGQTHIATMYVETFNYEYETQKAQIKDVLLGNNHTFKIGVKNTGKSGGEKDARGKQALKMMYVGFSRPTHLLCFAVLEENITKEELVELKDDKLWIVDKKLIE